MPYMAAIASLLLTSAILLSSTAEMGICFTDVTASSGISFRHNSGRTGKKWLPETMGSGCAFLDADGDGWIDILLINGKNFTPSGPKTTAALYRNNHNGTFSDITNGSGLNIPLYGFGVAIGDYDNDGLDDIYITALDGDRLFHNEGGGRFRDITKIAGINNTQFGTSAAWFDYDNDGTLDLFVANYVAWTPKKDMWCSLDGRDKSYCTLGPYKGTHPKLYRNTGNGKFEDVTDVAGLGSVDSKSLGVAVLDFNNDGWPDLFVANDTEPNKLWRNLGNGQFKEEGVAAGIGFNEDGVPRGGMGTDSADYDRSGRPHLVVGNYFNEMIGLYHNEGNGLFINEARQFNVGLASRSRVTFGIFFFDYDLDGYPDIFAANGHLDEDITQIDPGEQYKQLPLLFHNLSGRGFKQISAFTEPVVGRGAAYGDYDRDGDLDVLISTNNDSPHLYRNDGAIEIIGYNLNLLAQRVIEMA